MFSQYTVNLVEAIGLLLGSLHFILFLVAVSTINTTNAKIATAFTASYSLLVGYSFFGIVLILPGNFVGIAVFSALLCLLLVTGGIIIRSSEYYWRRLKCSASFFYGFIVFAALSALCLFYLVIAQFIAVAQVTFQ